MSGGYWDRKDWHFCEEMKDLLRSSEASEQNKLYRIFDSLQQLFHEVDWCKSGDTNVDYAKQKLYDGVLNLGEDLFGDNE